MPPIFLGPATRYAVRGNLKLRWVPKAAMPTGVLTKAILEGATTIDLTAAVATSAGWSREQGDIPAPDIASQDTSTVPGEVTRTASSLTLYLSKDGVDVRQALIPGDVGYMVVGDAGFATAALVDIWPATVKFGAKLREDLGRITIPFSTGVGVQENVPVPAA